MGTTSHGPVIAFLSEHFGQRDAKFSRLDETFHAPKNCFLVSELCFAKSTRTESNHRSQIRKMQLDWVAVRADLTPLQSFVATTFSKSDKLRADIRRLMFNLSGFRTSFYDRRFASPAFQLLISVSPAGPLAKLTD